MLSSDLLTSLNCEFRNRMKITWDDEIENSLIDSWIRSGIYFLNHAAGNVEIDFNVDLNAKELLYNYVLYSRNDCLDAFEAAYRSDLIALAMNYYIQTADVTEGAVE